MCYLLCYWQINLFPPNIYSDKASSQADELRMIHQQSGGPPIENPYGENVSSDKAPETISRAVASLPPEQMYEFMKQMKLCIQNNMNEARTMLLNNPQLAYALLQAQVVMRIVEPKVAMALLHRRPDQIPPIMPSGAGQMNPLQQTVSGRESWINDFDGFVNNVLFVVSFYARISLIFECMHD